MTSTRFVPGSEHRFDPGTRPVELRTDGAVDPHVANPNRTGPSRRHHLAGAAAWALTACIVVLLWPARWGGWSSLTVVSGTSMEPELSAGDIVVSWRSGSYDVGDVIVYEVPRGQPGEGHQVIHRVTAVGDHLVTKGDNKRYVDPWEPTDGDVVGRRVMTIPQGARVLSVLPWVLSLLVGVLVAAALWPSDETDEAVGTIEENHVVRPVLRPTAPTVAAVVAAAVLVVVMLPASASDLGGLTARKVSSVHLDAPAIEAPDPD